ncbi:MAG: rod shape-determining protein MreD [Gemmatimonadaceae bacterium]|nr:rod shape-determining protein MreD [Gemmatimonadaceae bacterium]
MNWGATLRTVLLCAVLIFLHYTLRPLLAWRASADFLIIALLLASVRVRPGVAAMFGFILGLASDSFALGAFGAGALAMTLIGYSWSRLKAVFFADHVLLNGFFLFLGKWAYEVVMNLVERRMQGAELLMHILVWSSLSAAVTAVAGVLALMLLRPVLETRAS